MVILMLERVPAALRGELTRWMIEPRTGVFVGNVSALVRDKLWEKINQQKSGGAAMLIHTARTEQGFQVRTLGDPSRQTIDHEGLMLIRIPLAAKHETVPSANAEGRGITDLEP